MFGRSRSHFQIEIAADLAGLGLALLLSWSVTR
jgi:hypothetical protein